MDFLWELKTKKKSCLDFDIRTKRNIIAKYTFFFESRSLPETKQINQSVSFQLSIDLRKRGSLICCCNREIRKQVHHFSHCSDSKIPFRPYCDVWIQSRNIASAAREVTRPKLCAVLITSPTYQLVTVSNTIWKH